VSAPVLSLESAAAIRAASDGARSLNEVEAKALLAELGMPVSRPQLVTDAEAAVRAARKIGYPVVLKIVSAQILHKSDAGCVILDVADDEQVRSAVTAITASASSAVPDATIDGIAVEAMARAGLEVFIGLQRDPTFGPTVLFGLGGTLVELLDDVSLRVLPVTRADAEAMLDDVRGARLLRGFRGHPARDAAAVIDVLLAMQKLAEIPQIESVDLNPVIVHEAGDGAIVVDAAIVLGDGTETACARG
jgi:succinyl-CoA synthetase beta subunit